jgi:subtilase family serine protease
LRRLTIVPIVLISLFAVACTATGGLIPIPGGLTGPTVTITSPQNGATFAVGSTVPVVVTALDTTGVSRLDLAADGIVVASFTTPIPTGQPTVAAQLNWNGATEGTHALTVTAYRPDGTAGTPASVTVTVGAGQATTPPATEPPATEPPATEAPTEAPSPSPSPTPKPLVIDLTPTSAQVTAIHNPDGSTSLDVAIVIGNDGSDPSPSFQATVTCQGATKTLNFHSVGAGSERSAHVTFGPGDTGTKLPSRVWVDPGKHVREVDRSNNTLRITDPLCIPTPPDVDLRLADVQVVGVTNPDGSTYNMVSVLIKNEGTDDSGPFVVEAVCQGADKTQAANNAPAGEYITVSVKFKPTDTGTDPNPRAIIDPQNHVKETDETNNASAISTGADLCAIP